MDIGRDALNKLSKMMEEIEGKSEDELIAEIAYMIKSGQGGLTPNKAKQMINAMMPLLDGAKRKKLSKLARALDR